MEKRIIELDIYGYGLILEALADKRNTLIDENKSTDLINETILRVTKASKRRESKRKAKDEAR